LKQFENNADDSRAFPPRATGGGGKHPFRDEARTVLPRGNGLDFGPVWTHSFHMGVPDVPPTLTHEQLADLQRKLSHMRHEVNNQLSLVVAALELARFRPEMREKMLTTLGEQPPKIMAEIARFSTEFEQTFGITRD
jgi:hypothetical protein